MAAVAAEIFVVALATLREMQIVTREQANGRMFDHAATRVLFEKGMAAIACIFVKSLSCGHVMDAMTEHVAQIPDFLFETVVVRVGIVFDREQQRMTALPAHILVMAGSLCNAHVIVTEYKAGDGVGNTRLFVLLEISLSTVAMLYRTSNRCERNVAHFVSK